MTEVWKNPNATSPELQKVIENFKTISNKEISDSSKAEKVLSASPAEGPGATSTDVPDEQTAQTTAPDEPCPRCGWHKTDDPKANEADMKEYLRCVLGAIPFRKTYKMYDGAFTVTLQASTGYGSAWFNQLLEHDPGSKSSFMVYTRKLQLLLFVDEFTYGGTVVKFPSAVNLVDPKVPAQAEALYLERFGNTPETLLRMLDAQLTNFLSLQTLLIKAGYDENFWKGAGPF